MPYFDKICDIGHMQCCKSIGRTFFLVNLNKNFNPFLKKYFHRSILVVFFISYVLGQLISLDFIIDITILVMAC